MVRRGQLALGNTITLKGVKITPYTGVKKV